jgi:hypothetical protein
MPIFEGFRFERTKEWFNGEEWEEDGKDLLTLEETAIRLSYLAESYGCNQESSQPITVTYTARDGEKFREVYRATSTK